MSQARPSRFLLPLALCLHPLLACECDRQTFTAEPDGGKPDAAQPPADAGPPPPEFSLHNGDTIIYPIPVSVAYCTEMAASGCTQQSATWKSEFTLLSEPARDQATNTFKFQGEYFWQMDESKNTDAAAFASMSKLWFWAYGPVQAASGDSNAQNMEFGTTAVMMPGGAIGPNFPFLDQTRWDSAVQAARQYAFDQDPEAKVEAQVGQGKIELGFLDPADRTQLHFVQMIYHPLGMLCLLNEYVGPWDSTKLKTDSGFLHNQRDFKSMVTGVRLIRASGDKAGQTQFCKCARQAVGSDCL